MTDPHVTDPQHHPAMVGPGQPPGAHAPGDAASRWMPGDPPPICCLRVRVDELEVEVTGQDGLTALEDVLGRLLDRAAALRRPDRGAAGFAYLERVEQ